MRVNKSICQGPHITDWESKVEMVWYDSPDLQSWSLEISPMQAPGGSVTPFVELDSNCRCRKTLPTVVATHRDCGGCDFNKGLTDLMRASSSVRGMRPMLKIRLQPLVPVRLYNDTTSPAALFQLVSEGQVVEPGALHRDR
jgi:hypothetical protein